MDTDINPLMESYTSAKTRGIKIFRWKSIAEIYFSRFRDQLLIGGSIILVTLCIGIVLSIIVLSEGKLINVQ